jgi:PAS domain S-box-containing protein/putative nucleotidyltransferase with HDIG domain
MSIPWRVLLVEDSTEDAELLWHLRRGDYDLGCLRVDTADSFEAALAQDRWDVLIVDHEMPQFDSLCALEIVKRKGLDVPVIIVSGVISDETAVNAMRAGAHDYILRQNLNRLLPVVERGLREATERQRRRESEAALRRQDAILRSLIEKATDPAAIVGTDGTVIYASPSIGTMLGYTAAEVVNRTVFEFVHPDDAAVLADRLERSVESREPDRSREYRFRHRDGSWRVPETVTHNLLDEPMVRGIVMNTRDVTDRERTEHELTDSLTTLRSTLEATIGALSLVLEKRDPYTAGHQQRVAESACAAAQALNLSGAQIETIRSAGSLHDIGKIQIPAEILSKPGPLTDVEMALIRNHPEAGSAILKALHFPGLVATVVLQHHERLDGSGYPGGLSGDSILLEARILGVADVAEAMASHRPYRPAFSVEEVIEELRRNQKTLYDERVVDVCTDLMSRNRGKLASDRRAGGSHDPAEKGTAPPSG